MPSSTSSQSFSHRFYVPLHEVDAAGLMFFGHLFRHAHDAYEAFMSSLGHPLDRLIQAGGPLLPLVHAEADYLQPLRHGETLRVELGLARLGRTSFTLAYRVVDDAGDERARVSTVHVCLGPDRSTAAPLPEALAAALRACFTQATQG